jgi:hypothetical protein
LKVWLKFDGIALLKVVLRKFFPISKTQAYGELRTLLFIKDTRFKRWVEIRTFVLFSELL